MNPELLKQLSNVYHGKVEATGTPVDIVVVAKGILGDKLITQPNFAGLGVKIVAVFADVAEPSEDLYKIFPLEKMPNLLPRLEVQTALVCTPHREAADTIAELVKGGVVNIWNWSGAQLPAKKGVAILDETIEWED